MIYQRISLSTSEPVGEPGPLPFAVAGWAGNPDLLADLSGLDPAYELTDAGFWPVVDEFPPFDSTTQALVEGDLVADPADLRFVRSWTVEDLPVPVPAKISDRQFFTALWKDGERITYEEALAAVTVGAIPAEMEGFLSMLEAVDAEGAREARLLLSGATEFYRDNYLIPVFASMYGMTEVEVDALWRLGATL